MSEHAPLEKKARPAVAHPKPLQRACAGGPTCGGNDRWETAGAPQARLQAALDGSPRVVDQSRRRDALADARALGVQPQLMIGAADDPYEQEADRLAREVVSTINEPAEAEADDDLVGSELMEEEKLLTQRAPSISRVSTACAGGETEASPEMESAIGRARGGGESLPETLRGRLEDSLGADLAGVRIHRDAHADRLNRRVQAKAFTLGQDVFFRKGLYNPGSRGGQELLAHELTHVVQQGGDAVRRRPQRRVSRAPAGGTIRRVIYGNIHALLSAAVGPANVPNIANLDPEIQAFFGDAENHLGVTDVVSNGALNRAAEATPTPMAAHPYRLEFNPGTPDQHYLVSSILHELIHVASARDFRTGGAVGLNPWLNLNLPAGLVGGALTAEVDTQENVLNDNMEDLYDVIDNDNSLTQGMQNHLATRVGYAQTTGPKVHYDTVIADMMTYMQLNNVANGPTWAFLKRMAAETNDRRLRDPWWGTQRARRVERNAAWYEFWKW